MLLAQAKAELDKTKTLDDGGTGAIYGHSDNVLEKPERH